MFQFLWIFLSLVVAVFGVDRKFGFWGYFFASLLLSPFMGILLLLASERHKPE